MLLHVHALNVVVRERSWSWSWFSVVGRVRSAPNHGGAHFLHDRGLAAELVRGAGVRPGDLVLDLGAGGGAITGPLVAAGARVLAVERDAGLARRLERRFAADPVTVVHGDLRRVPLPRRPYRVVASIPFAVTAALLRRLLDDPRTALERADLIVEWGMARRLATPRPRDLATAWWAGRFDLRLKRRVPAACFRPPPRVDAAHLAVRPRALAGDPGGQRLLRSMLRAAFANPRQPLLAVVAGTPPGAGLSHRRLRRVLAATRLDHTAPAASPTGEQWHDLALELLAATGAPGHRHAPASGTPPVSRGRSTARGGARQAPSSAARVASEGDRRAERSRATDSASRRTRRALPQVSMATSGSDQPRPSSSASSSG
jgi:23S rRNA (adenine-N6)-dimethyltransferase